MTSSNKTEWCAIFPSRTIERVRNHLHGFLGAAVEGMNSLGVSVDRIPGPYHVRPHHRKAIVWGWKVGQVLRQRNIDVLVLEHGYLGDRMQWTSIASNGLNGRGVFAAYQENNPGERLANCHPNLIKPWSVSGDSILLIGQMPGDASLMGLDLDSWYRVQIKEAAKRYPGAPIIFREHPGMVKRGVRRSFPGADTSTATLAEDFERARLVITFNSNTGVEAVAAGLPTVVCDEGSMAWSVRSAGGVVDLPDHPPEPPEPPIREKWASDLAWCQFTKDEIRSGYPLQAFASIPAGQPLPRGR